MKQHKNSVRRSQNNSNLTTTPVDLNRREFITNLALGGALAGAGIPVIPMRAHAAAPAIGSPIIVSVYLGGGPDFRHLISPPFDSDPSSYGYHFWSNRISVNGINTDPSSWQGRWQNAYDPVSSGQTQFGIHRTAGWLKAQWDLGRVAIINNVYTGTNRDHQFSTVILDSGDMTSTKASISRSGWGGRLAAHLSANVVSMTSNVRQFCFCPHPTNAESHTVSRIVSARNSRQMGIYQSIQRTNNPSSSDPRAVMDRALQAYFGARADYANTGSAPVRNFMMHENNLRSFGASMRSRLADYPIPERIAGLYTAGTSYTLQRRNFGEQIRNLYDSLLSADLINMRVASLEYGGWDNHENQLVNIERNFNDIFGTNRALDSLSTALSESLPSANEQVVYVLAGEFGRQLASNGGGGTDHGVGMTVLVIGARVRGGIYGNLFPASEIADSAYGYLRRNSGIRGQTTLTSAFGHLVQGLAPGAGSQVFPAYNTSTIETAGMFANLVI